MDTKAIEDEVVEVFAQGGKRLKNDQELGLLYVENRIEP